MNDFKKVNFEEFQEEFIRECNNFIITIFDELEKEKVFSKICEKIKAEISLKNFGKDLYTQIPPLCLETKLILEEIKIFNHSFAYFAEDVKLKVGDVILKSIEKIFNYLPGSIKTIIHIAEELIEMFYLLVNKNK